MIIKTFRIWLQGQLLFSSQLLLFVLITATYTSEHANVWLQLKDSLQLYTYSLLIEMIFTSPQIGFHIGIMELLKGERKSKTDIIVIVTISTVVLLYTSASLMVFLFKKIAYFNQILMTHLFYHLIAVGIIIAIANLLLQRNKIYEYCNAPIYIDINHFSNKNHDEPHL